MDKNLQSRLDQLLEDEIQKGLRVVAVPEHVKMCLRAAATVDATVRPFSRVRFVRLTPRKRRLIQEEVMTRYNADLKNPNLLGTEELRKLTIQRGEWSIEEEKELDRLNDLQNTQALQLNAAGLQDRAEWSKQLLELTELYSKALAASDKHADEKKFLKDIFDRWSNFVPTRQTEYDQDYAASQSEVIYNPDKDLAKLFDTSPSVEATTAISDIDDLLAKVIQLLELIDNRTKLSVLIEKRAKIFANSIESRRDQAEEMARVFYCAESLDEADTSLGPIVLAYDNMWDLPDTAIQWVIEELVMFSQNIPETMRGQLEDMGFLAQVPTIGTKEAFVESPEVPSFKSDLPPVTETPVVSLDSTMDTKLTKPSSI